MLFIEVKANVTQYITMIKLEISIFTDSAEILRRAVNTKKIQGEKGAC